VTLELASQIIDAVHRLRSGRRAFRRLRRCTLSAQGFLDGLDVSLRQVSGLRRALQYRSDPVRSQKLEKAARSLLPEVLQLRAREENSVVVLNPGRKFEAFL